MHIEHLSLDQQNVYIYNESNSIHSHIDSA